MLSELEKKIVASIQEDLPLESRPYRRIAENIGMDPLEIRGKFGNRLVLWGGIDKRVLSRSKKEIEHEVLSKVPQLLKHGGYIPSIDHSVPPDVPFRNFGFYIDLIRSITCKACRSK